MSMFSSHRHSMTAGLLIGGFIGLVIGGGIVGIAALYAMQRVDRNDYSGIFGGLVRELQASISTYDGNAAGQRTEAPAAGGSTVPDPVVPAPAI